MIESQIAATPDAVAVSGSDVSLTYSQLDAWADRLSEQLTSSGVRRETTVAVIAERHPRTVAAILGVLRAGGTYVPIDPATPADRFAYVMGDSGAAIILGAVGQIASVPVGPWSTIDVGDTAGDPAPPDRTRTTVSPDDAAYIVYTSGSTGEPKGVVVSQGQIAATVRGHAQLGRPNPDRFLLLVSFAFDAVATGLYWTLTTGGHVVIPTDAQLHDIRALRAMIAAHEITHLDCGPALYATILGDEDAAALASLRSVIVGGEACPHSLVERHARLLPDTLLINHYGPTETSVLATTAVLTPGPDTAEPVAIGVPIPATAVYVADADQRLVPDGHTGELLLGGPRVARGYHRRPGLTADRFRPDPWSTRPGGRVYRTGDLVRRRPDGLLVYLGRKDHQVKVRGFRVELGEVERALASHPGVLEAVADVRTLGSVDSLVAWVALKEREADLSVVRAHAAQWLPEHMVPSRITPVDTLPRTVSGKVDRAALPTPQEPTAPDPDPLTPIEAEVAEMVTSVLGLTTISPTTDLFEAGATSLHFTKLAIAIWSRFGEIRLRDLFARPTIAGVAQMIEEVQNRQSTEETRPWDFDRLAAEAVLDPEIAAGDLPAAGWFQPGSVFVTGATGYLGSFLVQELIRRTDATIWCLVRADDQEHALRRVRDAMRKYLIWRPEYAQRLRFAVGDLAQPRFGLSDATYDALAREIDVIYHCGALVNFIYPYATLKGPNVSGTAEVLRLASHTTLKAVHHVSTIDVFLDTDIPRPFREDAELVPLDVPSGYPRSKWVAEQLIRIARERGIPCSVYRPGLMISHTETGASQTLDFLLIQIQGLLGFGVVPQAEVMFDAVPIDYAAEALTHISLQPQAIGRNYHLWHTKPVHLNEVHTWIRSFGYVMEPVTVEVAVQNLISLDATNPMYRALALMFDQYIGQPPDAFVPDVVNGVDLPVEVSNALRMLEGSGIVCPPMTEELAHKCFQYLVDVGFFLTPAQQRVRLGIATEANQPAEAVGV